MSDESFTSLKDHLLLAMPGMADPNFKQAVIYICEHSADGAMGLTINQPTDVPMRRIFEELEVAEYSDEVAERPLLAGGPVQQERGFVLHRAEPRRWESTIEISPEVCLTASRDIIVDIAGNRGPTDSYITLGYSGWDAGQLETELASNAWLVIQADPRILFEIPFEARARATAGMLGVDLSKLSSQAGHA